jgi:Thioesterase-like superfamily
MNYVYEMNGDDVLSTANASGPWSAQHQHGAAPTALISWAVERIPTLVPMQVARITVDLLRPVPIAPLKMKSEVLREGKKIQLCSVRIFAADQEVVRATILKIRAADLALPDSVSDLPIQLPGPDESRAAREIPKGVNEFTRGVQMRYAAGSFNKPGPAAIWFKAERPIVAGEGITPLMRAAIASDYCNGTSSPLDFNQWTFINGDLTINLSRMPVGEWILLDSESYIGTKGAGVAFARLGDVQGYFGRAVQSLVIEPRST